MTLFGTPLISLNFPCRSRLTLQKKSLGLRQYHFCNRSLREEHVPMAIFPSKTAIVAGFAPFSVTIRSMVRAVLNFERKNSIFNEQCNKKCERRIRHKDAETDSRFCGYGMPCVMTVLSNATTASFPLGKLEVSEGSAKNKYRIESSSNIRPM